MHPNAQKKIPKSVRREVERRFFHVCFEWHFKLKHGSMTMTQESHEKNILYLEEILGKDNFRAIENDVMQEWKSWKAAKITPKWNTFWRSCEDAFNEYADGYDKLYIYTKGNMMDTDAIAHEIVKLHADYCDAFGNYSEAETHMSSEYNEIISQVKEEKRSKLKEFLHWVEIFLNTEFARKIESRLDEEFCAIPHNAKSREFINTDKLFADIKNILEEVKKE